LNERVHSGMLDELSLEDRINDEVRVILEAFQEDMRRTGASYRRCSRRSKTSWRASTRRCYETLRDKVNKLAHVVADTLAEVMSVSSRRIEIRFARGTQDLEKLLVEEERLDAAARLKISSQQRISWKAARSGHPVRKYYNDEVKRIGI